MEKHIHHQLEDYVLGLLSPQEQGQVEQHASQCAVCQQALQRERQLGQLLQNTLRQANPPLPTRHLRQFQPKVPRRTLPWQLWPQQLAPLALIILLGMVGLGWQMNSQASILTQPTPTYLAITATHTNTPPTTAVSHQNSQIAALATTTPYQENPTNNIQPPVNRAPFATPVAVLPVANRHPTSTN